MNKNQFNKEEARKVTYDCFNFHLVDFEKVLHKIQSDIDLLKDNPSKQNRMRVKRKLEGYHIALGVLSHQIDNVNEFDYRVMDMEYDENIKPLLDELFDSPDFFDGLPDIK